MTIYSTTCLFSAVKNTSGGTKRFPVIPPHGVQLTNNEEVTVFGDIREAVNRGDRSGRKHMDSLEAILRNGGLQIVYTPAPILQDLDDESVKMLVLDTGSLAVADPCFEVSIGE